MPSCVLQLSMCSARPWYGLRIDSPSLPRSPSPSQGFDRSGNNRCKKLMRTVHQKQDHTLNLELRITLMEGGKESMLCERMHATDCRTYQQQVTAILGRMSLSGAGDGGLKRFWKHMEKYRKERTSRDAIEALPNCRTNFGPRTTQNPRGFLRSDSETPPPAPFRKCSPCRRRLSQAVVRELARKSSQVAAPQRA